MSKRTKNIKRQNYLYILERVSERSLWARITGQREVKIGITTNLKARQKSVNKSTKGKVVLSYSIPFRNAYRIERRLHRLFSDSNFRMRRKGNRSNGEIEWFYMNSLEMIVLLCWIQYYKHAVLLWIILLLASTISYCIYLEMGVDHSRPIQFKRDGIVHIEDQ